MKKVYALLVLSCFIATYSFGQQTRFIDRNEYYKLKKENKLNPNIDYKFKQAADAGNHEPIYFGDKKLTANTNNAVQRTTDASCSCMMPLDATFQVVQFDEGFAPDYRNDDGSSYQINLPFNFCLYGTNFNTCYINNNGNISFNNPFGGYLTTGFPTTLADMVAPFWADVDTQGPGSGLVYYKTGPNYMIVKWDHVGYFPASDDMLNTFQLIISDGTDTILPGNNNVAFCYGDMQWTTGSATGGTGGFGGTGAIVGFNQSGSTTSTTPYFNIGIFDHAGNNYDGPYGSADGVSWLDNQSFYFNVCGSANNIAPQVISGNVNPCASDTIRMCTNTDTVIFSAGFSGPESNQTVTVSVTSPTLGSALTYSQVASGGQTNTTIQIIANPSLVGYHIVTITATDNGNPALSTTISYIIDIPAVALPAPTVSVTPPGPLCGNTGATVTLNNCSNYSNILWSDGSSGCSILVNQTQNVQVTVTAGGGGCTKSVSQQVTINPAPQVVITGDTNFCNNNSTQLTANVSGISVPVSSYTWNNGANTQTATISAAGPAIVTVTDANGCVGKDTVTITNITPPVTITPSVSNFCPGTPVTLSSSITSSSGNYVWTGGTGGPYPDSPVIVVNMNSTTSFTLQVTNNGCVSTNTITLTPLNSAQITNFIKPLYCVTGANTTPSITAIASPAGATITWMPGGQTGSTIIPTMGVTYTVTASVGTCVSPQYTVTADGPAPSPVTHIIDTDPFTNLDTILCYRMDKYWTQVTNGGLSPYTYHWTPVSGGTNDTVKFTHAGEYYLTVTDANGCTTKDSIHITQIQPVVNLGGNAQICPNDTGMIVAVGYSPNPFTIDWQPPGYGHNDTIYTSHIGQYIVTITDNVFQCQASKTFNLASYPVPNANFTVSPEPSEINTDAAFVSTSTISAGNITQYMWNFGDDTLQYGSQSSINHNYAAPGTYPVTLIVTSNRGCMDTVVIDHEVYVVIPIVNIITPNSDNINSALRFQGLEFFPDNKISIFNRWGNKIYEADHYDNKWDGKDMEAGTYYYILEIPKLKPQDNKISSFFQIVR